MCNRVTVSIMDSRELYERETEAVRDMLAGLEEGRYVASFHAGPWLVLVPGTSRSPDGYPMSMLILPSPTADPEVVARGISTTTLRNVPMAEIARQVTADKDARGAIFTLGTFASRNPGRRDDVYYTLLADAYVTMTAAGDRKPMPFLAGILKLSLDTVRGQVREATRRGLLLRSPGRAGGSLTDKARAILDGTSEEGRNALEEMQRDYSKLHEEMTGQ